MYLSDHSAITLKIKLLNEQTRGHGYWKFNASHCQDEQFCTHLKHNIFLWKREYIGITDYRIKWEILKYEIGKFCRKYGAKVKKDQNINVGNLLQQLHNLECKISNGKIGDQISYDNVKQNLLQIEQQNSRGSIIRSRAKWIEDGEKPTQYFFNLEKANYIKKHIRKLTLPGGTTTESPEEILEYQKFLLQFIYVPSQ